MQETRTLHTSERILREAARLFADRGFAGTSIEDIGAACGTSGPAIYKHFANKKAILAQMLLDISKHLVEGGRQVAVPGSSPADSMGALVRFHAAFAVSQPALIRVQDRDLGSLDLEDSRSVRKMQREYLELWAGTLQELDPALTLAKARVRAHAIFGLLNSTPYMGSTGLARRELVGLAERALGLIDHVGDSSARNPGSEDVKLTAIGP